MGINIRAGDDSDPDVMVDINTTPLVDVLLVLLVMLIITIPIQLHSVAIEMPGGNPPPQATPPEVVKIDITGTGQLLWNGQALEGRAALDQRLQAAAGQAVQPEIHIRPDKAAKYDAVAGVLAASQRLRLDKIGVVGAEQFAP